MSPTTFPEQDTTYAKDQPEYQPLPAYRYHDHEGTILCCWQLSIRERLKLLFTGRLWQHVLTFNLPLHPQRLSVDKPEIPTPAPEAADFVQWADDHPKIENALAFLYGPEHSRELTKRAFYSAAKFRCPTYVGEWIEYNGLACIAGPDLLAAFIKAHEASKKRATT